MNITGFSVSMCVYGKDNPEYFDVAIESVIDQTLLPAEIVLAVDGPIPETIEKVIESKTKLAKEAGIEFKVIRLNRNMGHGEARRICLENCSYSLIALMDADDISKRDRFEKEVNQFLIDPNLAIVGSHVSEFIGDPNAIKSRRMVELTDENIKIDMKKRCPMNQPSVMFKKDAVIDVGGYLDWYCNEDYYLWIRLALGGYKFANIDDCLVNMRMDIHSYQRRGGLKYFSSEEKIQKLLLDNKVINLPEYLTNVVKRLIVQVLMPSSVRRWAFQRFARN